MHQPTDSSSSPMMPNSELRNTHRTLTVRAAIRKYIDVIQSVNQLSPLDKGRQAAARTALILRVRSRYYARTECVTYSNTEHARAT